MHITSVNVETSNPKETRELLDTLTHCFWCLNILHYLCELLYCYFILVPTFLINIIDFYFSYWLSAFPRMPFDNCKKKKKKNYSYGFHAFGEK